MRETVTQSFCERCGTGYAFKAPTRLNPLRRTRGLVRGLKNYVMSSDSMSDAVGDSLHAESESLADSQLAAFHRTFNFCMNCRQYACPKCWNVVMGRCLTCAPARASEPAAAGDPAQNGSAAAALRAALDQPPMAETDVKADRPFVDVSAAAWPEHDVLPSPPPADNGRDRPADDEARSVPFADEAATTRREAPQEEAPHEDGRTFAAFDEDATPSVADATPRAPGAALEDEPAIPVIAAHEPGSADLSEDQYEEAPTPYEEAPATAGSDLADEWPAAAERRAAPEPPPVEEQSPPELVIASSIADQTPVEPDFPDLPAERVAAAAETPEAIARREQLELLGLADPGRGAVASPAPDERLVTVPVLPTPPLPDSRLHTVGARVAALWEASTREVAGTATMAPAVVHDCDHCGLSLSANARFCRRCGQRQSRAAG